MLEANILGCGSSFGVPVVGCKCLVCKSDSKYNKRLRSSIIINHNETKILVDSGFDIKKQLINAEIDYLDAAVLTHAHADHISGIDELRIFFYIHGKPLDLFVPEAIFSYVVSTYSYLFDKKQLKINVIKDFETVKIKNAVLQFFPQIHGSIQSLGIRAQDFVYSCDISAIPLESEKYLSNINVWVIDCMSYKPTVNHAGLETVLEWNKKYKPQKIYLTNMSHNIDYHQIVTELPSHITPLYDGFKIKL